MADRAVVAAVVPFLVEAGRQAQAVVHLADGHALVGQVQGLVVQVAVQVALLLQHLDDLRVAPARPVVHREHHLGLPAETMQRLVDVLAPAQRIAYLGAAQGVQVVQGADHVLGHQQGLLPRQPDVHLRRRLGARRVLEGERHAVQHQVLALAFDQAGRRQQAQRSARQSLADGHVDLPLRPLGQLRAVLVGGAAHHGVAGQDVLLDRRLHEAGRSDDLHRAAGDLLWLDQTAHASKVIGVGVAVDHRTDRPLAQLTADQFVGRPGGGRVVRVSTTIQPLSPRMKVMLARSKPRTW